MKLNLKIGDKITSFAPQNYGEIFEIVKINDDDITLSNGKTINYNRIHKS